MLTPYLHSRNFAVAQIFHTKKFRHLKMLQSRLLPSHRHICPSFHIPQTQRNDILKTYWVFTQCIYLLSASYQDSRYWEHLDKLGSILPSWILHPSQGTLLTYINKNKQGWRDGSVVNNSSCCSYRGHGFSFRHPQGDSQLPIPPVSGDLTPSSDLCSHQAFI